MSVLPGHEQSLIHRRFFSRGFFKFLYFKFQLQLYSHAHLNSIAASLQQYPQQAVSLWFWQ